MEEKQDLKDGYAEMWSPTLQVGYFCSHALLLLPDSFMHLHVYLRRLAVQALVSPLPVSHPSPFTSEKAVHAHDRLRILGGSHIRKRNRGCDFRHEGRATKARAEEDP